MRIKDLLTKRSTQEQSDCCDVEIVPVEDDEQTTTHEAAEAHQEGESCEDTK